MQSYGSTTPFGRRLLTLAHVATQSGAKARPPEKAVHKWQVFRAICAAKAKVGASEGALAVLDALLSFHPETTLIGEGLIVFPSNEQLSLRAHGMAPATLRRRLATLVDCGLIIRRDSPNGKRYARKGRAGEIETAFGFDLSPLVARADQFEAWAEAVRAEGRALRFTREQITLCRRDIAKMIATAIEEGVPAHGVGQGLADWAETHARYRQIVGRIPRRPTLGEIEPIAQELSRLAAEILNTLENHVKAQEMNANESHSERHIQNSNPQSPVELEAAIEKSGAETVEPALQSSRTAESAFPLGMVLSACPDIADYSRNGTIADWRDFLAAAHVARAALGISPSAWIAAQAALGERLAAIVAAAILQKGAAITSAGGYLRELTRKAEAGQFSPGPMLMALIGARGRERRPARDLA